jgi:hypothetical protein
MSAALVFISSRSLRSLDALAERLRATSRLGTQGVDASKRCSASQTAPGLKG